MPTRLWRTIALAGMLCAFFVAVLDVINPVTFASDHVIAESVDGYTFTRLRVTSVTGNDVENGGIKLGDIVTPQGGYVLRWRESAEPPGTKHVWLVQRGAQRPFTATSLVTQEPARQIVIDAIVHFVRFAMILMALLVAFRRPDVAAARRSRHFLQSSR